MSDPSSDPLRALTEGDRTLFDLYRITRQIKTPFGYTAVVLVTFVGVYAGAVWAWPTPAQLAAQVRGVADAIFQFAATILGIVIAGFAIFATISTTDIVGPFASIEHDNPKMPELKFLALHFVAAFLPYLLYIALHTVILAFGWEGGPAAKLAGFVDPVVLHYVGASILATLCAYLVLLLIVLQSFVYNVYKAFMAMARAKAEMMQYDDEAKKSPNRNDDDRAARDSPN